MKEGSGRRGRTRSFVVTFSVVVIVLILLVVMLALTVFKPRKPITRVDSISIKDLHTSLHLFEMKLNVNLTLNVDVSVENRNKYGFKYYDGSSELNYRGELIGEAPIPNGELPPDETNRMNLTLTLMADRLLTNSHFISDVATGALPLNTLVRISGEVNIFGLIKLHAGATSSCDFSVGLANNTIMGNHCTSKTNI